MVGARGDAWHVRQQVAALITGMGGVRHLVVVGTEVVVAEIAVFEAVSMRIVVEQTKANVGISTGYLA